MYPSPVIDLKTFVPAQDSELSKKFYTDLGFTINWSNEQIAELQIGSFRFLLQTFYVAEHAGNFMMSLQVAVNSLARWPTSTDSQKFDASLIAALDTSDNSGTVFDDLQPGTAQL